mgnify:FL=1|tara:strand:- start:8938 stop:10065 length:1128 start_codon:yes stop_codon:yes gene_type:complete
MKTRQPARTGDSTDEIETPALVVDLDALDENMATMVSFMTNHPGLSWRGHAKTHKSIEIARRQIAAGAVGICVQKTAEAETFASAGIPDILVTNQVVDARKLRRLAVLAKNTRIGLCCDAPDNACAINAAAVAEGTYIDILIEIETGANRAGVDSTEDLVDLAKKVIAESNLRFRGLQAYNGPAQHKRTLAERSEAINRTIAIVADARAALERSGIQCETITGGGTGTFTHEAASGIYTEIQPGSFIFMDADYSRNRDTLNTVFHAFHHSLFVLTTVTSVRRGAYALVDAGHKAAAVDSGMPIVADNEKMTYIRAADEYGVVELADETTNVDLGMLLHLIPGHCDPTVNLHDWIVGVRGKTVECVWPVDARGALL